MSSLPGYTLEAFLSWNFDVIVDGDASTNVSLQIAEAIGTIKKRRELTKEQFAPVVALFEEHRKYVEDKLSEFDEDNMSWRQYASYEFGNISDNLYEEADELLNKILQGNS